MQPSTMSPAKDAYYSRDQPYMKSSLTKSVTVNQTTVKKAHPFSSSQTPYTNSPNPYANNYSLSASNDELELYKSKCQELEHQLAALRGELDVQRVVNLKASDLEGKVGDVVGQNHHL